MEDFENNLNIVIKDIFIGQDIEIKVKDNGKNNFFSLMIIELFTMMS